MSCCRIGFAKVSSLSYLCWWYLHYDHKIDHKTQGETDVGVDEIKASFEYHWFIVSTRTFYWNGARMLRDLRKKVGEQSQGKMDGSRASAINNDDDFTSAQANPEEISDVDDDDEDDGGDEAFEDMSDVEFDDEGKSDDDCGFVDDGDDQDDILLQGSNGYKRPSEECMALVPWADLFNHTDEGVRVNIVMLRLIENTSSVTMINAG